MCDLAESIWKKAYIKGFAQGYAKTYAERCAKSYEEISGKSYAELYDKFYAEAYAEGKFKAVAEFYRTGEYSAEFAASYVDMTVAEFLDKAGRAEEDIPETEQ